MQLLYVLYAMDLCSCIIAMLYTVCIGGGAWVCTAVLYVVYLCAWLQMGLGSCIIAILYTVSTGGGGFM